MGSSTSQAGALDVQRALESRQPERAVAPARPAGPPRPLGPSPPARYRPVGQAPTGGLIEYERVSAEVDARQMAEWTIATLGPLAGWSCLVLTFAAPDGQARAHACTHATLNRRVRASNRCSECQRGLTLVGVPIEPREPGVPGDHDAARIDALAARLASTDSRIGAYCLDASRVLLGPLPTTRYVAGGKNYYWSFIAPGA
jgi:hypothetical protein